MWKVKNQNEQAGKHEAVLGIAYWCGAQNSAIRCDDPNLGIRFIGAQSDRPLCSITAVDDEILPAVSEQFVRGDELHVSMPQSQGTYGVRLVAEPVECAVADCFVLQLTIAIQTTLLDTHPKLDLVLNCQQHRTISANDVDGVDSGASPAISVAEFADTELAVLLGPHDCPFTTNFSTSDEIRLRLFGDFLEKGVIRKARPWLVFAGENGLPGDDDLTGLWQELQASPLPLTP